MYTKDLISLIVFLNTSVLTNGSTGHTRQTSLFQVTDPCFMFRQASSSQLVR